MAGLILRRQDELIVGRAFQRENLKLSFIENLKKMRQIILLTGLFLMAFSSLKSVAQCSTSSIPTYPSGCTDQYFTSVTAGGTGVASTISYTGSSCAGPYHDYYGLQGVTAPTGSTVNINVSRFAIYQAYLAVYVDWNNNSAYEPSELVGTIQNLVAGVSSTVYSFTIPLTGIATNTPIHMRVFLGEPPTSSGPLSSINPPCSAKWGQTNDYHLNATCTTPIISVAPASPVICQGGTVTLSASGAGSTATYLWSPAAGLSATTGATVISTPAVSTTYTVTGYAPGVCATNGSVPVTISAPPAPVITSSGSTTICSGSSVVLTETSGTGTTYQWYTGSAPIAGATNASYTAAPTTTTVYSLSLTNAAGCTGATTTTVNILAAPTASTMPAGSVAACSPASTVLTAPLAPGYTYRWFNSMGVMAGEVNQTYTASTAGNYYVEITATTGCKDTSAVVTVAINPSPVASATASGPLTFCFLNSVTLNAIATPGYTYQWFDGTTPITGATANSYFVTGGVGIHDFRVSVTNIYGCQDTTASGLFPVVVNPVPASTISAGGPLAFCAGGDVALNVPYSAGTSYTWYYGTTPGGAMPISGATTSSYTATATGYYYVTAHSTAGCSSSSAASPVLVTSVPTPTITHTLPTEFCWGSHVTLDLNISAAPGIVFTWKRNGVVIPGATADSFHANISGTYECEVNVSGGGCVNSTTPITVTMYVLPNPIINYVGGKLVTDTFYTSYQWYRNSGTIGGATTYKTTPALIGDYSVLVTDTNGCVSMAPVYPLTKIKLGSDDLKAGVAPNIYPNPATDRIFIEYGQEEKVVIMSADGRNVLESQTGKTIDISGLANGIYVISVYDVQNNRFWVEKFAKQ